MKAENIRKCVKESFVVIGKEGSTEQGKGFIQKLWEAANAHYQEVEHLAKTDENGVLVGLWGVMSDMSHSFLPWQDNFSKGLYLAGVECNYDAQPPEGWVKWVIPSYEYLYVECKDGNTFSDMVQYLKENNISLVGAAHDFTNPVNGTNYIFFPIRKIDNFENLEIYRDECGII